MARKNRRRQSLPEQHAASEPRRQDAARHSGGRRYGLLAGVALLVVVAAVLVRRLEAPGAGSGIRRAPGMSVLLVTIDTLRADALGAYGQRDVDTPLLDRLAAEGVRFDFAHAHNVVTLPSHANILSGRYPLDHGVRDNAGFRFPDGVDTLATLLGAKGYATGAFVSAFTVDSQFGLARGFDVYDDSFRNLDAEPAFIVQERPGAETVTRAREWIGRQRGRPWFAWVHVFEPHYPYAPPEPFATRHADNPYLGEVAATDALLRPLLEPILAAGNGGDTLVVVTADHGESLGEHGERTHGIFAYEATLRVPLIVYAPRLVGPGVIAQPVRHVDILPTVLDALGQTLPGGLPGRSLLPAIAGDDAPAPPTYFEALTGMLSRGWAPLRGVIAAELKYIDLPLPELYDLDADPRELEDLSARRAASAAALAAALEQLRSAESPVDRVEETAEARRHLEALGYVTSSAASPDREYTAEDDPKRLIALDDMFDEIAGRHARGDLAGALEVAEALVARRPQMPASLIRLGFLRRETGDLAAAVEALERALALNPRDVDAQSLLGAYLNEAGRPAETVRLLAPYVARERPDVDVAIAHGVALAQLGRFEASLEAFGRARAADPSHAMLLVNMGTTLLMAGERQRARSLLLEALDLNPALARAHNTLGVIAARDGRTDEAIERWRRAVELDPREFDTLYNLGVLLRQQGREAEARAYLERFAAEAPPGRYAADIAGVRAWLASR